MAQAISNPGPCIFVAVTAYEWEDDQYLYAYDGRVGFLVYPDPESDDGGFRVAAEAAASFGVIL